MPQFIDYLFTLRGTEREIFTIIFDDINHLLAKGDITTENLVNALKNNRFVDPMLQQYDTKLTTAILTTIIKMLEDEDAIFVLANKLGEYNDRYLAATMLGWFGPKAWIAIPQLVDLASGSSGAVGAAKQSIILIGQAESQIMAALLMSIAADDDGEFRELWDLIVRAGHHQLAPGFLDTLQTAAQSNNPDMKEAVVDAIEKLDALSKQKVSFVLDQLKDDSDDVMRKEQTP
jgi:hypothetical protein